MVERVDGIHPDLPLEPFPDREVLAHIEVPGVQIHEPDIREPRRKIAQRKGRWSRHFREQGGVKPLVDAALVGT